MQKFQSVLLRVWREACKQIKIHDAAKAIATMLVSDMPLAELTICRINTLQLRIEKVAKGFSLSESDQLKSIEYTDSVLQELLQWCQQAKVSRRSNEMSDAPWKHFIPEDIQSDFLVGSLTDSDGRFGLLVLKAQDNISFSPRHESLAAMLLDPFSAALQNDHLMREMATLREAAEADKRSLLSRLGRTKLVDTVVGAEAGLSVVMQRVELVAHADVPVLIFGETGTGKELIARAIHERSHRSSGPVVRVNCGAIPPELIDSQLFGHQRGAFTGAVEARKGWFERANGGTLFLDEIGELPLAAQVRLLRVLQDGWLERVGGAEPVKVDVRIVAATHRDLAGMVAEGTFREDLWYRLAVFPIRLPPLRDRLEDIPDLVRHFVQRAANRFGLPVVEPGDEHMQLLSAYHWPGNIRELATVIDRAAILGDGKSLEVAKALGVFEPPMMFQPCSDSATDSSKPEGDEFLSLDDAVRKHIETALRQTRGRIEGPSGAANLLKINPHTLRARMRKLGIDWARYRQSK